MQYRTLWQRLYYATRYATAGLKVATREEQAFRFELWAGVGIVVVAVALKLPVLLLTAAWLIVLALELANSAVERAFDLISREYHPEIGKGKDMMSAAVFLAIVVNVLLWVYFLCQRVCHP